MAQLAKTSYPLPKTDSSKKYPESYRDHFAAFESLCSKSSKIDIKNSEIIGLVVSYPYADGQAHYLVTKEKPLTLQHIPYGDAWQLPISHIKGIRKQDIITNVERRKSLSSMFSKN